MVTVLAPVAVAVALAVLLGRLAHQRLGFVTVVESVSMAPALTPGQRVLTLRAVATRAPRRGDVVVVESTEVGRPVVKRVVGLPGEHVDVGPDGTVVVAGLRLDEPYVVHAGGPPDRSFDVPPGHLLLLGDNRARSSDARSWHSPYVPVGAVLGRVVRPRWRGRGDAPGRGSRSSAAVPSGSPVPPAAQRGAG